MNRVVPVLTVLLILTVACGGGRKNAAEVKAYCAVYDDTQHDIDIATVMSGVDATSDKGSADLVAEYRKREAVAPTQVRDAYADLIAYYQRPRGQLTKPSEGARFRRARDKIESFTKSECGFS
jgi:hypothetical protein